MPLIFIGGARGSGKSTLVRALNKNVPEVENINLAVEAKAFTSCDMFKDEYVGMRRLTPEQQYRAVSEVIRRLAENVQENPSRVVFIDGHFISTSYVDNHENFFPLLRDNARLFDKIIWLKIEPDEILYRRFIRERVARTREYIIRDFFAEGLEARLLGKSYPGKLIVCRDDEFFRIVYSHLGQYLIKQTKTDGIPVQRQVQAVLRLLRGEEPHSLSRQLGVTATTLAEWRRSFVKGGTAGLKRYGLDGRDHDREIAREIARLKTLVMKMTAGNQSAQAANQNLSPDFPLALTGPNSSAAPFTWAVRSGVSKKQDA